MEKKFRTTDMNVKSASSDQQGSQEILTKSLSRMGSFGTGRSNRSKQVRNRQRAFEELEQRQLLSATTMEDLICIDPTYDSTLNGLSDNTMDQSTLQKLLTASGLTLTEKDILNLNSVPGAKATIYLDFDGHTTSGTAWNTRYSSGEDFVTPRFNLDGNATKTAFSSEELWAIYEIWLRVSEDYAPFEVNVTTKDPGADALTYNGSGDNAWGKRVCIGGSCDDWIKESCGGIAYLNSFYGYFQGVDTPCYVFSAQLGVPKSIAECASHESGHTLGLSHDGSTLISGQEEYYQGANGWCPIMGASYYQPLTQWSKGEYVGATNKEDDLNIIATRNGFTYKADDFGNDIESAYKLSPHKGVIAEGLIETNTDYDFFEVNITGKPLQLQVSGLPGVTNLDIGVSLYDAKGNLLKTYAPTDALYVTMDLAGYVGTHYISVTGTGNGSFYSDYASLGAYTLEVLNDYIDETVIVVTTERDIVSATDGQTSLREAITKSGTVPNATILFASDLKGKTLSVTKELTVTNTVTIDASALYDDEAETCGITINGSGVSRIFNISNKAGSTVDISLNGLVLTGGRTTGNGGALLVTGTGADALSVSLTHCLVTGNASTLGGGLYTTNATVKLTDTVVSLNNATLNGGGIYVAGGSFSLLRGSVSDNKVTYGDGGGLYITGNTAAVMTDTLVINNDAKKTGGGLYIAAVETQSEGSNDPTISLVNTNVTQNSALSNGGGLFVAAGILLTDCTIDKNDSLTGNGGGLYFAEGSSASVLTNSVIEDNYTHFDGGGIYTTTGLTLNGLSIWNNVAQVGNGGGIAALSETSSEPTADAPVLKISASDISSNAVYEGNGAGLWLAMATEIADSTILGNYAAAGLGAGIYAADTLEIQRSRFKENTTNKSGAALYYTGEKNLVVANSEIASNAAEMNGAGVYFASTGNGVITNNTIVANYVHQGVGAGIYATNANLAVYNSIIVENYIVTEEITETGTKSVKTVSNLDSSTPGQAVIVGKYNISNFDYWADAEECLVYDKMPQFFFKDFEGGDYHILFISEALNAGSNDYVRGDSDLDGLLRICYNPNVTWEPFAVDVGAYEYQELSGNDDESPYISSPNWHTPACKADGHNAILKWTTTSYQLNKAVSYNLTWTARFADGDVTSGTVVVPASGDGVFIDYTFVPPFSEAATISFTVQGNVEIHGKLVRSNVSPILILSVDKLPGSATQLDSPINLTATATGTDSVKLNWIAGRSNNQYEIEYSTSSRFSTATTTKEEISASTQYTLTGLLPNTTYFIRMRQMGDGVDTISSAWTSNCFATTWTLPLTPGNGSAIGIGADQIMVTLDAIEGAASYLIEYSMDEDFASSKTTTETTNQFVLSALNPNTTYYMRYKVNSMGGMTSATWSNSFLATTTNKLTAPYNIQGLGSSPSSQANTSVIDLTWNGCTLADSYVVEYRLAGKEEWTPLEEVTKTVVEITGLKANSTYEIQIQALDTNGSLSNSDYSAIATVVTPAAPVSTDILLSSQYVQSNAAANTLVGRFDDTDLTGFELVEGAENNSLFVIAYNPDNGYELYANESLDDGVHTISVKAKNKSDSQWLAEPQILEITAYRPEVTANMTKVNTAEERAFSLSGNRIDDTDTLLTWNWKYTKDGAEVIKTGQNVEFAPGELDLPVAPETSVQIELYAVDQNGIQSESVMIEVVFDDKANLYGTMDETLSQFNILKLRLDTLGTTAQSWSVNWGDNTSTQVDVRSSSLSLAHYYAMPGTYDVTYSITTVGGVVIESDPTAIKQFTVSSVANPILMPEAVPEENDADVIAVESVLPSLLPEETESQLVFANSQPVEAAPLAVDLAPDFFTASRFGRGCGLFSLNFARKDRTGILAHNDENDFYRDIVSSSVHNGVNTTLDNYFGSEFEADLVDLWS